MLAYEADAVRDATPKDAAEVVNYILVMNHGRARPAELPLSLRLLREIHTELMQGARGGEKSPGEFRASQNWIGGAGSTLKNGAFIPPPPDALMDTLGRLERFLHEARDHMPLLVRCALAHAQFETIHPFLDGNGRVGHLMVTLLLSEDGAVSRPLLYLSLYLKAQRAECCDSLTAIRQQGHREAWIAFFLKGVSSTARSATQTARAIVALRDEHRAAVARNAKALTLLDQLMSQPTVSIKRVARLLSCTQPTAAKPVDAFEQRGWLRELTGCGRNRLWRDQPYDDLFHGDAIDRLADDPPEVTGAYPASPANR